MNCPQVIYGLNAVRDKYVFLGGDEADDDTMREHLRQLSDQFEWRPATTPDAGCEAAVAICPIANGCIVARIANDGEDAQGRFPCIRIEAFHVSAQDDLETLIHELWPPEEMPLDARSFCRSLSAWRADHGTWPAAIAGPTERFTARRFDLAFGAIKPVNQSPPQSQSNRNPSAPVGRLGFLAAIGIAVLSTCIAIVQGHLLLQRSEDIRLFNQQYEALKRENEGVKNREESRNDAMAQLRLQLDAAKADLDEWRTVARSANVVNLEELADELRLLRAYQEGDTEAVDRQRLNALENFLPGLADDLRRALTQINRVTAESTNEQHPTRN